MAKNKRISVAIVYSSITKAYFPEIKSGFEKCANDFKDFGLSIEYFCVNEKGLQHQKDLLKKISSRNDIDGIVIQPVSAHQLDSQINKFQSCGIPVVTFGADAPHSHRLCYVGPNAYKAGRVAAQLMSNYIHKRGHIYVITQLSDHMQTQQRMKGFSEYFVEHCSDITVEELHIPDNSDIYSYLKKKISTDVNIAGLFGTDAEFYVAGSVLKDLNKKDVTVIGFDLWDYTISLMKENYIQVIIEQNPADIAYKALNIIFEYLFDGTVPEKICRTGLSVLTSECLK